MLLVVLPCSAVKMKLVADLVRDILPCGLLELAASHIGALLLVLVVLSVLVKAHLLLDGIDALVTHVLLPAVKEECQPSFRIGEGSGIKMMWNRWEECLPCSCSCTSARRALVARDGALCFIDHIHVDYV